MKIKDLPGTTRMGGLKVKTPDGQVGYWVSQWSKGVWLSAKPNQDGRIYPVFVESLMECEEWEVDPEDGIKLFVKPKKWKEDEKR